MGRGTGLGLASVYGIIRHHGGIITVESRKGEGTRFAMYLPARRQYLSEETAYPDQILHGEGTVLLVDDEDMILDVGQQILKALGYKVLTARSGGKAVEIYEERHDEIEMVILDMIMPDMSGGETFDRIKQINPQVRVLLSSGYSVNGQASEILGRGCDGFIQKPFNIQQLSKKMRDVLGKQG
jgi:CheY-like chemotaxis protein